MQVDALRIDPKQTGRYEYVRYPTAYSVAKEALSNEGIHGLYKGYWATLASFGPFSALYFVFYENVR